MKQLLLVSFALVFISASEQLMAQGFSVNINAAPQFSFIRNKDDKNNAALDRKGTLAMRLGLGAGYQFTKHTGVGLNLYYSWQGQKYEISGRELKQKLNYVRIPAIFVYNTDPSKTVAFVAKAGPQLSILASSKLEDGNGHDVISDTDDRYENVTFGAVVRAGIQVRLGGPFFLETGVWFDNDFTDAEDKDHPSYAAGRAKSYNMTTGLQVQLKYVLSKK
jgi:hypothetical protein